MADFEYVSINTTAEKIERIANMDIDDVTLDENSKDNSLPTSKLVFNAIKKEVENEIDQNYSSESSNAQSGKAVAQATNGRIPKIITEGHTVSFKRVIALQEGMAGEPLGADDKDYVTVDIATYGTAELPFLNGEIATYGNGGRLNVNTPIKDFDCANKAYVDTTAEETAKETANDRIPKIKPSSAPFLSVLVMNGGYTDGNGVLTDDAFFSKLIDDTAVEGKTFVTAHGGYLVQRDPRGNLWTGEPVDDEDCVPKKYVDDKIGDIDSALTKLHNYAQALIGGNS